MNASNNFDNNPVIDKIRAKFKQIITHTDESGSSTRQIDIDSFSFKEIYEKVRGNLSG